MLLFEKAVQRHSLKESIIIMPAFGVQLETHYSRELHPPVKMLIPIWKALCAATDNPVTQVPSR
ncbi:unnamed protein product [Camellia sinensis]